MFIICQQTEVHHMALLCFVWTGCGPWYVRRSPAAMHTHMHMHMVKMRSKTPANLADDTLLFAKAVDAADADADTDPVLVITETTAEQIPMFFFGRSKKNTPRP